MKWLLLSALLVTPVFAHDDGRYAQQDPKMHQWFEGLRSEKGPCCSDADGSALSDSDWVAVNDPAKPTIHYRVRIPDKHVPGDPMEWFDVPDEAVLTQPNLYGRTMVWPIYGYLGTTIRCFIPGAGI